jgi:hypothetical protein
MIKKIIFITGLGGSGTRVYANILDILNINLGTNINNAKDNLSFFNKIIKNNNINFFDTNDDNYNIFKDLFKTVLLEYNNTDDIICIKGPCNHILYDLLILFCKRENYEMISLHIIRDGLYMINSNNKNQIKHGLVEYFSDKFNIKYNNTKFRYLEYWYYLNMKAFTILKKNNIKHLILYYDNILDNKQKEIMKILKLLNRENEYYKFNNFHPVRKKKKFVKSIKFNIVDIPPDLKYTLLDIKKILD